MLLVSLILCFGAVSPALAAETFGAEMSNPTQNPIGGGEGYSDIFTPGDPRVTVMVSDSAGFFHALENARPGDVIYIEESATIDLTGIYYGVSIPAGVTIASNRGYEGSPGGRILQNRDGNDPTSGGWNDQCALKTGGDNVRVTGLRLEGPDTTTEKVMTKTGLKTLHKNIIVDNCEISGWSNAGINADYGPASYATYVHHNYIHHCQRDGLGYGVLNDGITLIEANIFDYCRHMIADDGDPDQFYEARYNIFGEHTGNYAQQVDAHAPGGWTNPRPELGTTIYVHHNTFLHTGTDDNIRLHPSYHTSHIDHNVFYRTDPLRCVYVLYGYENIVVENNVWGVDTFAPDDSAIVRYFDPEWMPIFGRPIEPPQTLSPLTPYPGEPVPTPTPAPVIPDHAIPGRIQAADYDEGGEGLSYHDTTPGNAGGEYRFDDVDIVMREWDENYLVAYVADGEWLTYTADISQAGTYDMQFLCYCPGTGRSLTLSVDGAETFTGDIPPGADWTTPVEVTGKITFQTSGEHVLKLQLHGGDLNINCIEFTPHVNTAGDVLFVVRQGTLNNGDAAVKTRLEEMDYAVTVVPDELCTTTDAAEMDLVVISSSCSTTYVGATFRDTAIPVLTWESWLYDDMMMTGAAVDADYGAITGQTQIDVAAQAHPLAAGLEGVATVITSPDYAFYGVPGPEAQTIATIIGDPSRHTIFAYEKGAEMVGMNAPARRVGFFLSDTSAATLTGEGWALFEAAVAWVADPTPLPPEAAFEASVTAGELPLTVQFTDLSTNSPASWQWTFGDGETSAEQNPAHTYLTEGTYTIALTVTNEDGIDNVEKQDWITAVEPEPAGDILFVVGENTLNNGDAAVRARLEEMDYAVTVVPDELCTATGTAEMDLVVISSSCSTTYVADTFRDTATPVLTWESWLYDDMLMTGTAVDADYGAITGQTQIDVAAQDHPLAAGLEGVTTVITSPDYAFYGVPGPGAQKIATIAGDPSKYTIFAYEKGAEMAGMNAPARRIGFFLSDTSAATLTGEGWALFEAAVAWAADPDPLPPGAAFEASVTGGEVPLTVEFTDLSTNSPASWQWTFGDGETSAEQNPAHTYVTEGTYTVALTVTNGDGIDTIEKTGCIDVVEPEPAGDILFVVRQGTLNNGDAAVKARLEEMDYTVSVVPDELCTTTDAAEMDLVIISSSCSTTYVGNMFRDAAIPVLTWESWLYDDMMMTGAAVDADYGAITGQTQINVIEPLHPLAAGLEGIATVITSPDYAFYGVPGPGAQKIATIAGDPSRHTIFAYEKGAEMVGMNAPARRVGFFLSDTSAATLTGEGWALFEAAVAWVADPTPLPPEAAFETSVTAGELPLTVQFTDLSTNSPASWQWTFGDGETSAEQNPAHTYVTAGTYTVALTVTNEDGIDTIEKSGCIDVVEPEPVKLLGYLKPKHQTKT